MPSIHLRPGKRTFYLDTSTLSYAFRGGHPAFRGPTDTPAYVELFELVERISHEANLCVSTMHLAEMAQGDVAISDATLRWLDRLDLVWMYSFDKVGNQEDDRALQLAVGATPIAPVEPFAPSLLRAFEHWRLDSLAEALSHSSPLVALGEAARVRGRRAEHDLIDQMQRRLHYDRNLDPTTAQMTAEEKASTVARKRRATLAEDARLSFHRLRARDAPDFHARYRATVQPDEAFADYVIAKPTALPSYFICEVFAFSFSEVMARRTPGSKAASKLKSSFFDYAHLGVGAAYCDVFTCDGPTAECLGDAPVHVGRALPLFVSEEIGGAPAFVRALTRAVERA